MAINQEMLAGYKALRAQLVEERQRAARSEAQLAGFRQELLDFKEAIAAKIGPVAAVAIAAAAAGAKRGAINDTAGA